jgi:hypothetical protein
MVKQLASWLNEADKATGLFEGSITGLVFIVDCSAAERGSSTEDVLRRGCGGEKSLRVSEHLHRAMEPTVTVMLMTGSCTEEVTMGSNVCTLHRLSSSQRPGACTVHVQAARVAHRSRVRSRAEWRAVGVHLPVGTSVLPGHITSLLTRFGLR